MAYSLLGIFDIQMPLLYGEGRESAFDRLLEAIKRAGDLPLPVANDAAFDSRAEEHNPRCHHDTRVDLLDQIQTWASDSSNSSSSKSIFWLNGMAGTGKSTVSRTMASRFKGEKLLGASFFFKRGERDRGNASLFFTTIATQLTSLKPQVSRLIRAAVHSDPTITTKALGEQFEHLILQPLSQADHRPSAPPVVIVVDALDECDCENDAKLIIHIFSQAITKKRFTGLRVFITSRPELPIRLGFRDVQGDYENVALHRIPKPVVEHDIAVFLRSELRRIRQDYNSQVFEEQQLQPDWPGEYANQALVRMATPLFIFAATICRFLEDENYLNPADQLAKVLSYQDGDSELNKLEATYLPVIDQLVAGKASPARSRVLDEFRNVVGPIVLLAEPLSASSLSQLLDIPIATITRILSHLHAVLDIPRTQNLPIRPFHLSFYNFLTEPTKSGTNEYWIDKTKAHQTLATTCIQHLATYLRTDICNVKRPGKTRAEIGIQAIDSALPAHVQYACQYWASHLRRGEGRVRDGDQTHRFLARCFLQWLEALSLMGRLGESVLVVNTLRKLVEVSLMMGE